VTRTVALLAGVLPIVAIHGTYLVSAWQGHVPWCVPYFESCTSISATGRYGASFYLFKGTMIPAAVLLMFFWYLTAQWLRRLGDTGSAANTIFVMGVVGAAFLIVYAVALGAAGDTMRLQRRVGVILYFTLTYLAQLVLVWRMGKVILEEPSRTWLLALCVTTLSIGITTVFLSVFMENYQEYEDAFEWILALLVHLYFLVLAGAWKRTGFKVSYAVY
jgi:hypothetical protein